MSDDVIDAVVEARIAPETPWREPESYTSDPQTGHVRWDLAYHCVVGFANDRDIGLNAFASMADKDGRGHRVERSVTADQLRDFACRLIELAGTTRQEQQ